MPKRKGVELLLEPVITDYGQEIKIGENVLFFGTQRKTNKTLVGIYSGKYVLNNEVVSVRINNVNELNDRRPYSILKLKRIFKLQV